jgi:phosphoglycerate dehydrogenase-like enzyme
MKCLTLPALALLAVTRLATAAEPAGDVREVMQRLRIQESPTALSSRPGWQTPKKIVLLAASPQWSSHLAELQSAVPASVRLVPVRTTQEALREVADADAMVGFNPEVCDAQLLAAGKSLRWVQNLSAGIELCADGPATKMPGLVMSNMRGVDSPAIGEHAVALMMALAHGLDAYAVDTSKGVWNRGRAGQLNIRTLEGKTVLVVGLGGIGTEVARRAAGLGMKVIATRQGPGTNPPYVSHVGQPDELLKLAPTADVIVSCVPLTKETTDLYDAKFFATMKPTAYFINVARGGSVVTEALVKALDEHRIAGAGHDVVDPEPLPPEHPLWKSPRVLITPHISSSSDLPGNDRWTLLGENLRRFAAGGKLLLVVDLQRGY